MNETYRIAKKCIDDAKKGINSGCVCIIRPANSGKTHTAQILSIDEKALIIPSMSISEQKTWFNERIETPYYILDDPSDWFNMLDRQHVLSILKNLLSGYLKSSRATKFDINMAYPVEKKVAVVLFMTDLQYSSIRRDMELVGLSARMEVYYSNHSIMELERIKDIYKTNGYSSANLPMFDLQDETEYDPRFLYSMKTKKFFSEEIILKSRPKKVKK